MIVMATHAELALAADDVRFNGYPITNCKAADRFVGGDNDSRGFMAENVWSVDFPRTNGSMLPEMNV